MDPRTLGVVVLFAFIFMVMLKAYCIGIVWRCYKYLTIRQNASLLTYIIPEGGNQERSFNSLLPDYEEALSMKVAAPPSYDVAMQTQQSVVVVSPPMVEPVSPVNSSSETDPPSYHAAHETPTLISTNQGSLDDTDEIHVDAATVVQAPQTTRDQ